MGVLRFIALQKREIDAVRNDEQLFGGQIWQERPLELRFQKNTSDLGNPIPGRESSLVRGVVKVDEYSVGIDVPIQWFRESPDDHDVLLVTGIEIPPRTIGYAGVHHGRVPAIVVDGDVPAELRQLSREIDDGFLGAAKSLGMGHLRVPLVPRLVAIDDEVTSRRSSFDIFGVALDELLEQKASGPNNSHSRPRSGVGTVRIRSRLRSDPIRSLGRLRTAEPSQRLPLENRGLLLRVSRLDRQPFPRRESILPEQADRTFRFRQA